MDNGALFDQIVQNLSFEVEAVPQENFIKLSSGANTAPVNVKVRLRKKDRDRIPNHEIAVIPKYDQPHASSRLRLASSDQTIISFNMLMEADLKGMIHSPKPRKRFLNGLISSVCLGTKSDDDDFPYLPSSNYSNKDDAENFISRSNIPNKIITIAENDKEIERLNRKKYKNFFGKCKPGGCLDPPFGEDKYAYKPTRKHIPGKSKYEIQHGTKIKTNEAVTKRSSVLKSATDTTDILNKASPVVSLYEYVSKKKSLDKTYSHSIITYPPDDNDSLKFSNSKFYENEKLPNDKVHKRQESSDSYFSHHSSDISNKKRNFYGQKKQQKEKESKNLQKDLNNEQIDQNMANPERYDNLGQEITNIEPILLTVSIDKSQAETYEQQSLAPNIKAMQVTINAEDNLSNINIQIENKQEEPFHSVAQGQEETNQESKLFPVKHRQQHNIPTVSENITKNNDVISYDTSPTKYNVIEKTSEEEVSWIGVDKKGQEPFSGRMLHIDQKVASKPNDKAHKRQESSDSYFSHQNSDISNMKTNFFGQTKQQKEKDSKNLQKDLNNEQIDQNMANTKRYDNLGQEITNIEPILLTVSKPNDKAHKRQESSDSYFSHQNSDISNMKTNFFGQKKQQKEKESKNLQKDLNNAQIDQNMANPERYDNLGQEITNIEPILLTVPIDKSQAETYEQQSLAPNIKAMEVKIYVEDNLSNINIQIENKQEAPFHSVSQGQEETNQESKLFPVKHRQQHNIPIESENITKTNDIISYDTSPAKYNVMEKTSVEEGSWIGFDKKGQEPFSGRMLHIDQKVASKPNMLTQTDIPIETGHNVNSESYLTPSTSDINRRPRTQFVPNTFTTKKEHQFGTSSEEKHTQSFTDVIKKGQERNVIDFQPEDKLNQQLNASKLSKDIEIVAPFNSIQYNNQNLKNEGMGHIDISKGKDLGSPATYKYDSQSLGFDKHELEPAINKEQRELMINKVPIKNEGENFGTEDLFVMSEGINLDNKPQLIQKTELKTVKLSPPSELNTNLEFDRSHDKTECIGLKNSNTILKPKFNDKNTINIVDEVKKGTINAKSSPSELNTNLEFERSHDKTEGIGLKNSNTILKPKFNDKNNINIVDEVKQGTSNAKSSDFNIHNVIKHGTMLEKNPDISSIGEIHLNANIYANLAKNKGYEFQFTLDNEGYSVPSQYHDTPALLVPNMKKVSQDTLTEPSIQKPETIYSGPSKDSELGGIQRHRRVSIDPMEDIKKKDFLAQTKDISSDDDDGMRTSFPLRNNYAEKPPNERLSLPPHQSDSIILPSLKLEFKFYPDEINKPDPSFEQIIGSRKHDPIQSDSVDNVFTHVNNQITDTQKQLTIESDRLVNANQDFGEMITIRNQEGILEMERPHLNPLQSERIENKEQGKDLSEFEHNNLAPEKKMLVPEDVDQNFISGQEQRNDVFESDRIEENIDRQKQYMIDLNRSKLLKQGQIIDNQNREQDIFNPLLPDSLIQDKLIERQLQGREYFDSRQREKSKDVEKIFDFQKEGKHRTESISLDLSALDKQETELQAQKRNDFDSLFGSNKESNREITQSESDASIRNQSKGYVEYGNDQLYTTDEPKIDQINKERGEKNIISNMQEIHKYLYENLNEISPESKILPGNILSPHLEQQSGHTSHNTLDSHDKPNHNEPNVSFLRRRDIPEQLQYRQESSDNVLKMDLWKQNIADTDNAGVSYNPKISKQKKPYKISDDILLDNQTEKNAISPKTSLVSILKTGTDEDSITLDLAFQLCMPDNKITLIKTLSRNQADMYPENAFVASGTTKFNDAVRIPMGANKEMNLKVVKSDYKQEPRQHRNMNHLSPDNLSRNSFIREIPLDVSCKKNTIYESKIWNAQIIRTPKSQDSMMLARIYEEQLVPLKIVIENFKTQIDSLADQQLMIRKRLLEVRRRQIRKEKKMCGCMNKY